MFITTLGISAPLAPKSWAEIKSPIIGSICYFMVGWLQIWCMVYPLSQPTSNSSTPHPMWKTMSTLGHKNYNPFCIGGELVVGGDKNDKAMSDIHHY